MANKVLFVNNGGIMWVGKGTSNPYPIWPTELTLSLSYEEAKTMLLELAEFIANTDDGDSVDITLNGELTEND